MHLLKQTCHYILLLQVFELLYSDLYFKGLVPMLYNASALYHVSY